MDTFLAIVSLRAVREYSERDVPHDAIMNLLEAGRVTGSSQNRQQWQFYVVQKRQTLNDLAPSVYAPSNLTGCRLAIGISTRAAGDFDVGRCAHNMALAAWNRGVGSTPNGIRDAGTAKTILGIPPEERLITILSFGYPRRPVDPESAEIDGVLQRINRKPLDELVVWAD